MTRAVQLYTFKNYCDEANLGKEILECGAGVYDPEVEPLFLRFHQGGYVVHGIDRSESRLENARSYCEKTGAQVDLRQAEMLQIPYADDSMSFVYSYNAIFHSNKEEMRMMVSEMGRVLKPNGLCFVNFLSVEDDGCGEGDEIAPGEYQQIRAGHPVLHSYLEDDEAQAYFRGFKIVFQEKRVQRRLFEDGWSQRAYIDTIVEKE